MKFMVEFTSNCTAADEAVDQGYARLGLDALDAARKETGVAQLSQYIVDDFVHAKGFSPEITICEYLADKAGCFRKTCRVVVVVPERALNKFTEEKIKIHRNSKTGEIENVQFSYVLNEDNLLTAWAKAGYPLKWDVA